MYNLNWEQSFKNSTNDFHNKIISTLNNLPDEKEKTRMNKKLILKRGGIILASIMAFSVTAFAAVNLLGGYSVSGSSTLPIYTEFPSSAQIEKDFGFTANPVEEFKNGFVFSDATLADSSNFDDAGNVIEEYKDLSINYTKGEETIVASFNTSTTQRDEQLEPTLTYDGVDFYYSSQTYKFVSPSYEMTEQDNIDQETGKYMFSFGGENEDGSTKTSIFQFVSMTMDGLNVMVFASDVDVSEDEMLSMAKEIAILNK